MPRAFLEKLGVWRSDYCQTVRVVVVAAMKQLRLQPATHVLQPQAQNLWNGCRVDFENLSYARFQPKLLRNSWPCASSSKVRLPRRCAPGGKGSRRHWLEAYPTFTQQANQRVESNGTCPDNLSQSIPPGRTFQISLLVVATQQSIGPDTYRTIISNISICYVRLPISSNSCPCNEVAQECHPR